MESIRLAMSKARKSAQGQSEDRQADDVSKFKTARIGAFVLQKDMLVTDPDENP